MLRVLLAALILASALLISGCAQDEYGNRRNTDSGNIPWNRPEKWEGPGVMGSQMSQQNGGF